MSEKMDEQLKLAMEHTIEQIGPDEEQTDAIWRGVQAKAQQKEKKFPVFRVAAAGMCVLALCVATGAGVNAATDGAFFESLRAFVGMPEQQKKVADEGITTGRRDSNVYADPLVACSDEYIVFANERGLMIYGREEQAVLAALDLQALDCNYFNADTVMTHVMMQDNLLYIYNEYKEKNTTEAYTYDLTQVGQEQALNCVEDPAEIAKIRKNWMAYAKEHCKDTFDTVPAAQTDWNGSDILRYSKKCITWTDDRGIEWNSSLLTYDDGTYKLYTYAVNEPTDVKTEVLNLNVSEDATQQEGLPAFEYTGEDTILKTICDYMCSEDQGYDTEDAVYIPAPVIYATVTKGDEVTVFANLWSYVYKQNGNTLDCEAGGEQPSRLKLKSDGNGGYTITEHLTAGDGEEYVKDIEEFCKEYQVSPEKFIQAGRDDDKIRKELVKMYVDNNNLDIKYIKDYGWDPIPIDDTQES